MQLFVLKMDLPKLSKWKKPSRACAHVCVCVRVCVGIMVHALTLSQSGHQKECIVSSSLRLYGSV